MTVETAQAVAVDALGYLAGEPDELNRFLQLSGLEPDRLREAARHPGFLVGVLDYLLGGERSLAAFEVATGIAPATVAAARSVLAPQSEGDAS